MNSPVDLAALQREVKRRTDDRVREAMKVIEEEVGRAGCYSRNGGKITLVELLKRADVGSSTLRNQHHRQLRDEATAWLRKLGARSPVTAASARAAGQTKIAEYEQAMRKMTAQVAVLLSEKAENKGIIERQAEKIRRLEKQLREVARRDTSNVIIFPEVR
ncbi:hypothetical protein WG901_13110 [Novosphingobium sp. PS1R-30]|uniref:Uncharacterized protein n=1 Tax=Novosphingobium anseongense TaxID=3133436 RepID=A0ABU8RWW9_9SPHN